MNKKEVNEIRKQFHPDYCAITRICGCYVTFEKEKKFTNSETFLMLEDEEAHKYFDIFKKSLSGSIGKNLLNLNFPLHEEAEGGTQEFILRLRNSKLLDDSLLEELYDRIIASYIYPENFYITVIHAVYDIPGKSKDGFTMEDASDDVYDHILISICPVKLSKAGLSYDVDKNDIGTRIQDWVVGMPDAAILFPAFNERTTDVHSCLFYTQKASIPQKDMIAELLGSPAPASATEQVELFYDTIQQEMGEDITLDSVKEVYEELLDIIEEHKEEVDPLVIGKQELYRLGLQPEEDLELMATNIPTTFTITNGRTTIKVDPERLDSVSTRTIDGRECIVIEINDQVLINGMPITHRN